MFSSTLLKSTVSATSCVSMNTSRTFATKTKKSLHDNFLNAMNTSSEKERRVRKCTDLYLFTNSERFTEVLLIPDLFHSSSRNRHVPKINNLQTKEESPAN